MTRSQGAELIELRDRLETDLAYIILPELFAASARGFYIILSSEVEGLQLDGRLGGMTHPAVSEWLRAEIGDRWRGHGPGMLIVDGENCSPERLTAKAVHETAHIVTAAELFSASSPATNAALTHLVATPPSSWPAHRAGTGDGKRRSPVSNVKGHEIDFLRAVLHIGFRMAGRGHSVCPALLLNWDSHGYRSGWRPYFEALESELESRESEAITAIANSPYPPGFVDLWRSDIANVSERATCALPEGESV